MADNVNMVSISNLMHEEFIYDVDDTMMYARLLYVKKYETGMKPLSMTYDKRPGFGQFAKRQATGAYDLMLFFNELRSRQVFVVICHTAADSGRFIQDQLVHVGCIVLLREMTFSGAYLGSDDENPIIKWGDQLSVAPATTIFEHEPIRLPISCGVFAFCIQGLQLRFQRVNVVAHTCSGEFCDRQSLKVGTTQCGCTKKSNRGGWCVSAIVLRDQRGELDDTDALSDPFASGPVFQSRAFAIMFIDRQTMRLGADSINRGELRAAAIRVSNYVNCQGGFTAVGWYKPGEATEGAPNATKQFHLSAVAPNIGIIIPSTMTLKIVKPGNTTRKSMDPSTSHIPQSSSTCNSTLFTTSSGTQVTGSPLAPLPTIDPRFSQLPQPEYEVSTCFTHKLLHTLLIAIIVN